MAESKYEGKTVLLWSQRKLSSQWQGHSFYRVPVVSIENGKPIPCHDPITAILYKAVPARLRVVSITANADATVTIETQD